MNADGIALRWRVPLSSLRLSVYASVALSAPPLLSLPPSPLSLSLELGSYSLFQFRNLQGGKYETDFA